MKEKNHQQDTIQCQDGGGTVIYGDGQRPLELFAIVFYALSWYNDDYDLEIGATDRLRG